MTNIEYQIKILNAVKEGKDIQWCDIPDRHYGENLQDVVEKGIIRKFKHHESACKCSSRGVCEGCDDLEHEDVLIEWMDWEFNIAQGRDNWRPNWERHVYRVKPEPEKRFMVFAGERYYPQGPMDDFICSVDSLGDIGGIDYSDDLYSQTLLEFVEMNERDHWVQILDRESGNMFKWQP